MIDTLYRYAKFQYECGNYSGAAEYLYFVRVLVRHRQTKPKQFRVVFLASTVVFLHLVE